jgi:hypothetical protein
MMRNESDCQVTEYPDALWGRLSSAMLIVNVCVFWAVTVS